LAASFILPQSLAAGPLFPFFYSGHGKWATGKLANALAKQMRKLARGRRGENAERRRLP
jgi:hypothetical protein